MRINATPKQRDIYSDQPSSKPKLKHDWSTEVRQEIENKYIFLHTDVLLVLRRKETLLSPCLEFV